MLCHYCDGSVDQVRFIKAVDLRLGGVRMSPTFSSHDHRVVFEFLNALTCLDLRCADLTVNYLRAEGYRATPAKPVLLPEWFLIDLGQALMLLEWEDVGVKAAVDSHLLTAREIIDELRDAFVNLAAHSKRSANRDLSRRVFDLYFAHIAWYSNIHLQASITVEQSDDALLVEQMAQLLLQRQCIRRANLGVEF